LNEKIEVPNTIKGLVLISASNLSSVEFGPGPLDPYGQFKLLTPTAVIDKSVFVFEGKFGIPLAAAISKVQSARNFAAAKQLDWHSNKRSRQLRWLPSQFRHSWLWETSFAKWVKKTRLGSVFRKRLS
jgi:hypothetical protein